MAAQQQSAGVCPIPMCKLGTDVDSQDASHICPVSSFHVVGTSGPKQDAVGFTATVKVEPDIPDPNACSSSSVRPSNVLSCLLAKPKELVWNSGVACNGVAALLQSLSTLAVKLTDGDVPVFEIVAIRSSGCFLLTLAWMACTGQHVTQIFGSLKTLPFLLLRGIAGAGGMSFFYFGVLQLTLADAVTIFFTHPALVIVLAYFWLGEALSWPGILGIVSSLLGVFIISRPPFLSGGTHWSLPHLLGVVDCFISALFATVAYVTIRYIGNTESPLCLGMWFHTMGIVSSIIPLAIGVPSKPVIPRPSDCMCMGLLVLTSFLSQAFIARAFQVEKAAKSASVGYLQVVFGYIFGLLVFHDPVTILGLTGSGVICVGVLAVTWPTKAASDKYHFISDPAPDPEMGSIGGCIPREPLPLMLQQEMGTQCSVIDPIQATAAPPAVDRD